MNEEIELLLDDIEIEIEKRYVNLIYLEQFQKILLLKDKTDILRQMKIYDISEGIYNRNLENLRKLFPNREKGINYLKEIYREYKLSLKIEEIEDFSHYLNLAKKILETGYSIEQYCAITGEYRISELREMIEKIRFSYKQVYYELMSLSYQNRINFFNHITNVIYEIKNNDDFDLFDYYYLTKLNPYDFLNICSELGINMSEKDMVKVKIKLRQLIEKNKLNTNKDIELNGKTIIAGEEITKEEKEKIFNLLEELNIPNSTYKVALKRYFNGDEKIMNCMGVKKVNKK